MTNPKPTAPQMHAAPANSDIFQLPEFQALLNTHLVAIHSYAQRHGHSVKAMGFVITTDDLKQRVGGFHGCTCVACCAHVMSLMEQTVVTSAQLNRGDIAIGQVH
jgi:hypothetical protein